MRGSRRKAGPRAFSRSGKRGTAHHRGLVCLRISDGKFVNHTTEMILWSMILIVPHQSCWYDRPELRKQIGELKLGTISQNGLLWLIGHSQILSADHMLTTLTLEKIVLVQSSAPSIGRWASLSSPRGRDLGILFPFLLVPCPHHLFERQISWQLVFIPKIWKLLNFAHKFVTQK